MRIPPLPRDQPVSSLLALTPSTDILGAATAIVAVLGRPWSSGRPTPAAATLMPPAGKSPRFLARCQAAVPAESACGVGGESNWAAPLAQFAGPASQPGFRDHRCGQRRADRRRQGSGCPVAECCRGQGDIHDPAPGGPFDAIVERGGPVVGSGSGRGAAAAGRGAGGLVVPIEVDLSMIRWLPENPLGTRVKSWLVEALARAGMVMLGPRLWAIVEEAGLRPLG